jgi:hypothetical protein
LVRLLGVAPAALLLSGLLIVAAVPVPPVAAAPAAAAAPADVVVAWGSNTYGETTVPAGLSGVIAIAADSGFNHRHRTGRLDGQGGPALVDHSAPGWVCFSLPFAEPGARH